MGRSRKIEARETVEARIRNAVAFAFGSPDVKLHGSTLSICLGVLDGEEVWLDLPFTMRREPLATLDDEDA